MPAKLVIYTLALTLYEKAAELGARDESVARWGDAVVWSEFHSSNPWPHAGE